MYEVEVKVRAAHGQVRERLAALDAERVERVSQSDTYYAAPHREFAETDEALRTRRETVIDRGPAAGADGGPDPGGRLDAAGAATGADAATDAETRLTYKGPRIDTESKTREEHETAVADPAAAEGILDGLGFDPAATVEKERDVYAVGEYVVTLDTVADLGEFVEVERTVEEADVDSAREGARALLRDLGLDPEEGIRTSYLELVAEARADSDEEADDADLHADSDAYE
ncbi:class IV adenylate cyclase [Candidatus Halobonum tyrrellensis]|uniref:Adenylyl cyclase CyaB n=1 Tax=Candidatus Halobonum tyrrellensis G22 TaxID=1324957 RepID=V4HFN5_9EURY|nr:class IV adenylate cyclase [Candidatus Halobonum tyrrellensis]ESP89500.1 adenylyl cyclase CyaB [Candidatus Halobonum tyrrellensis G22]